jgi:hypothetical protein
MQLFRNVPEVADDLTYIVELLKQDPIGCYVEVKNRVGSLRNQLDSGQVLYKSDLTNYIRLLERLKGLLEQTHLIKDVLGSLQNYIVGNREIYKQIFRPEILPNFTFTRLAAQLPEDAEFVDQYEVEGENERVSVTILQRKNDSKFFYHVMPPEYTLSEDQHMILNLARNVMMEHRPKSEEFYRSGEDEKCFFQYRERYDY